MFLQAKNHARNIFEHDLDLVGNGQLYRSDRYTNQEKNRPIFAKTKRKGEGNPRK